MSAPWHFLTTVFIIAFGMSLQGGYFMALYNAPQDLIQHFINESAYDRWHKSLSEVSVSTIWGTIASTNQAGKVLSSVLAPFIMDRMGRKWCIIVTSIVSATAMLLQYISPLVNNMLLLAAGRVISGVYNGIIAVAVPLFLVEVAITPIRRGSITRIHNIFTLSGSTVAFIFGVPEMLGTLDRWNYLPLVPLPLMIIAALWLLMVPESPMYMLQCGKSEFEVRKSLRYYMGNEADHYDLTTYAMTAKKKRHSTSDTSWWMNVKKACTDPELRKLIFLWAMLALYSAFSGTGILNNYSTAMLARTPEFSSFDRYTNLVINLVKIFVFLGAIYLINTAGRRPLLLISAWAVTLCMLALAIMAFTKVDNVAYTISKWIRVLFLFIWGCLQYVGTSTATLIVSETASQEWRAASLSIYKTIYHSVGVLITFAFPPLFYLSEGGTYLFLAIPALITGAYLTFMCPETKTVKFLHEKHKETTPLLQEENAKFEDETVKFSKSSET